MARSFHKPRALAKCACGEVLGWFGTSSLLKACIRAPEDPPYCCDLVTGPPAFCPIMGLHLVKQLSSVSNHLNSAYIYQLSSSVNTQLSSVNARRHSVAVGTSSRSTKPIKPTQTLDLFLNPARNHIVSLAPRKPRLPQVAGLWQTEGFALPCWHNITANFAPRRARLSLMQGGAQHSIVRPVREMTESKHREGRGQEEKEKQDGGRRWQE